MDDFLSEMTEILEAEVVTPSDELQDFESWDSLAMLSVVAMADANFGVKISSDEVKKAETVEALYHMITAKKAA